ncbi:subtilisin-like protein [Zopfia rhizophila CBS 207.26]|uniref:Subtilisin-like protein n=1 Tax=Zopfia rhizophila CBS 207.26 TaxID=1314779 RepID=A0A6A6DH89_9PEZI|nr:subtilisin-like protein [Zopfia rhizophila CBS 207.26]
MDSQPPDTDLNKLKDFVYEKNAGGGTFIYVINGGAAWKNMNDDGDNEFNVDTTEVLQTQASKEKNEAPDSDSGSDSHGTMVASIVVGKKYGVAKAATLVVVKTTKTVSDFLQGLELVSTDLKDKEDRRSKSVVISSLGFKGRLDHDKGKADPDGVLMGTYFDELFAGGTPFITSSGNRAQLFPNIDRLPKVLEDKDTPIINVGAVDFDGNRADFSQYGPQLTINGPGVDVTGQSRDDGKPRTDSGTSFSTPQVAGIIATYLTYDPPPWDGSKQGKERVQAIKDYILSDKSSWVRKAGSDLRVIWNGATKDDHKSVGANSCRVPNSKLKRQVDCDNTPPSPPPAGKKCYGTNDRKYVDRKTIKKLIDDIFCKNAAEQGHLDENSGSISRVYNQGSMEQLAIAMDWRPGLDFKPDEQKCKDIMYELMDGCDTNSNKWKGGGEKMDGEVKYRWGPEATRQPIDVAPFGGCDNTYKFVLDDNAVWGSGWLGADFGHALLEGLKGKGLSPTDWKFEYGMGDDKREWTAWFHTTAIAEDRIEDVLKDVSGIGVDCNA